MKNLKIVIKVILLLIKRILMENSFIIKFGYKIWYLFQIMNTIKVSIIDNFINLELLISKGLSYDSHGGYPPHDKV